MTPEEKAIDANEKRVSTFFYSVWHAIDDLEVFLGLRVRNTQALLSAVNILCDFGDAPMHADLGSLSAPLKFRVLVCFPILENQIRPPC